MTIGNAKVGVCWCKTLLIRLTLSPVKRTPPLQRDCRGENRRAVAVQRLLLTCRPRPRRASAPADRVGDVTRPARGRGDREHTVTGAGRLLIFTGLAPDFSPMAGRFIYSGRVLIDTRKIVNLSNLGAPGTAFQVCPFIGRAKASARMDSKKHDPTLDP